MLFRGVRDCAGDAAVRSWAGGCALPGPDYDVGELHAAHVAGGDGLLARGADVDGEVVVYEECGGVRFDCSGRGTAAAVDDGSGVRSAGA